MPPDLISRPHYIPHPPTPFKVEENSRAIRPVPQPPPPSRTAVVPCLFPHLPP